MDACFEKTETLGVAGKHAEARKHDLVAALAGSQLASKQHKVIRLGIAATMVALVAMIFLLAGGLAPLNVNITIISSVSETSLDTDRAVTSVASHALVARAERMDSDNSTTFDVSNLPTPSAASTTGANDSVDSSSTGLSTSTSTSTQTVTMTGATTVTVDPFETTTAGTTRNSSDASVCGALSTVTVTVVSTADAMSVSGMDTPLSATQTGSTSSDTTSSESTTPDSATSAVSTVPVWSNITATTTTTAPYPAGTGSFPTAASGIGTGAASASGSLIIIPSFNNTYMHPVPSPHHTAVSAGSEAGGMAKASTDKKMRTGTAVSYCLVMAVVYTVLGIF